MKKRSTNFIQLILKVLIVSTLCMLLSWRPCDANSSPTKPIVWGKTFGGKHIDIAHAAQQTSDGGYILAGQTFSFDSQKGDIYVIKLDKKGNKLWQKTFGGENSDGAESIQQTSDGGYIIAGGTHSLGSGKGDAYILKLDKEGNKIWEKTFGGKEWDDARVIQQTTDGGYIVAGGTRSLGSKKGEAYILKLDKEGNKIWEKTFKGNDSADAKSIQQTSDGGYIAAGNTYSFGSGKGETYVLRLDSKGNKMWEKMFEGKGRSIARVIQQTSDGGFILAGQTQSLEPGSGEAYIIKLDSKGNQVWEKILGIKDLDPASFVSSKESKGAYANSIQQTSDGKYIVAIATFTKVRMGDAYIVRLDTKGEMVWKKTIGIKDLDEDSAEAFKKGLARVYPNVIQQTSDGGYLIAGGITDYREGISDVYIIKTDPNNNVL